MHRKAQGKPHSLLFGQFILQCIPVHLFKETEVYVPLVSPRHAPCPSVSAMGGGSCRSLMADYASLMYFESFPVRSAGNVLLLMSTPTQLPGTLYSQENWGFLPTTATVCFR